MSDERITVRIQLKDAAKFVADAKAAGHEIEVLGDKADKASKKAKPFSTELERINKASKALRPFAIAAGISLIGQTLGAAATGGVAFLAALAPLGGLLATLPALGLAAGQGLGVLALSVVGVKQAMGGLNGEIDPKKFALLTPAAQDFALSLDSLRPRIKDLENSVQGGMFPGLTQGLRSAVPAIDALQAPLTGTGRVFGLLGARLGALVGSRGFLTDLRQQAYFNNIQFTRLGGAGLHVVNIMRNLAVAARPLVSWMVRLVAGWAASADHAVELGRATGGLDRMFHSVQVTMSRVGRIGGDLAMVFWNIGKVGKSSIGDSLLVSLVHGADALRKWTESGDGVQKMTEFFTDAKPVIFAAGHLLADVSTQLLRLTAGGSGGMVAFLNNLDSMVTVIGTLTRLIGPESVVYGFLALKFVGGAYKLMQIAKGIEAITAATTLLKGSESTTAITAATAQGAAAGRAYGMAFKAAGAIGIGLMLEEAAKKIPALSQYSGKKGWGELYRDTKHDITSAGHSIVHALTPHLPGRAMGGPVWPGQYLVGEQGPEILSVPSATRGWITPNHEIGRGPRSSPVSRATVPGAGMGPSLDHLNVIVRPQAIYLDGQQIAEVTADVAVNHAGRE